MTHIVAPIAAAKPVRRKVRRSILWLSKLLTVRTIITWVKFPTLIRGAITCLIPAHSNGALALRAVSVNVTAGYGR